MMKHGFYLVGLSGLGFSILAALSLRAPFLWLSVPGWYCVYPGIRIADFLAWPDSVLLIMTGNATFYSLLAFLLLLVFKRMLTSRAMRLASIWLAFPVAVLVFLALYPSLNPMLPGGMLKLEWQATKLTMNSLTP